MIDGYKDEERPLGVIPHRQRQEDAHRAVFAPYDQSR